MNFQTLLFRQTSKPISPIDSRARIRKDVFLSHVYKSLLEKMLIAADLTPSKIQGKLLIEIGSAGGITKSLYPVISTLDVRSDVEVDHVVSATQLPFGDETIDVVIGKDVFHHIPDVQAHLYEVSRVLKGGGYCVYLEPNWNWFSRFFYTFVHPEPWDSRQREWHFTSDNPMFSNQALPWIVFVRDLDLLTARFPEFEYQIEESPLLGLSYLISGGVNRRNFINGELLKKLYRTEQSKLRYLKHFGLSRLIVLKKRQIPQ
jgi:SAM-dependent methyltransferase